MLLAGTADIELAEPFLPETSAAYPSSLSTLSPSLTARLYISHFLSTWNSRLFEFGAVLFLADIFPLSLLPLSTYALVRAAAVILGAQAVGELVDEAGRKGATNGRLGIVRTSILGGRGAVVGSCVVFLLLQVLKSGRGDGDHGWKGTLSGRAVTLMLFVVLIALACVEKLCGTMNLVAIERDWVSLSMTNSVLGKLTDGRSLS
jgi:iron-regulated transporter 1